MEALYGGAAGGGKSDALLMAALQYVHVPGYSALILRRTFADLALPEAIMDRAKKWLIGGTDARWNDNTRTFTFPSGATLTFGYLQTEVDKYRYQGAEFQFVGFDELTQFVETQYTYLFSRLRRRAGVTVPIRMRCASNPGGIGHEWVKTRFVNTETNEGRVFIPATRRENPHVDNDAYTVSLSALDATTRKQLDEGDWDVLPSGEVFKPDWFAGKAIDAAQMPGDAGWRWVLYFDAAATEPSQTNPDPDWTAGALLGANAQKTQFCVGGVWRWRKGPGETQTEIVKTCHIARVLVGQGRFTVGLEEEGGASGKMASHALVSALSGFHVIRQRPTGDKRTRALPVATQAQNGNVSYVRGHWNMAFLGELYAFTGKDNGVHDDQVDAFSGAFNELAGGKSKAVISG